MAKENSKDLNEAVTMLLLRVTSLEQVLMDSGVVDRDKYLEELKKKDAIVFNLDGLETPDNFLIIEYEPTTRTRHSKEIVSKIARAAEMNNVNAKRFGAGKLEKTVGRLSGGSDAAAFSKAGIKAGFLNSADWKTRSSYYHQSTDTPDKIRKGTLENALRICLTFISNEKSNKSITQ